MSDLAALRKALEIGAISHDGDGWFAADAGYGYEDAEAAIKAGWEALALLDADRPAPLDDTAIERMARDHFEPYRHFYEGDGTEPCSECGEGQDQDFVRVTVHFHDGDG